MDSASKDQGTRSTSPKLLIRNIRTSVPSDRIRREPITVLHTLAVNDHFSIPAKSGDGSIPLSERFGAIRKSKEEATKSNSTKDRRTSQSSYQYNANKAQPPVSPQSNNSEYNHRGCCGKLPTPKSSYNRTSSPSKEKVPYFREEVRENDRLRRLYGDSRRRKSRSLSPACSSKDRSRRRRRSTSRDKHRDYSQYKRTRSESNNGHRSTRRSRSRSHTSHRERSRQSSRRIRDSHSPCCSHNRHLNDAHRSSRSHSSPRRYARSSSDRYNDRETKKDERQDSRQPPPASMYIPVPVPIPDFAYSFPHWPLPQNPWTPHIPPRAPAVPYGFSLIPVMRHIRPIHPIRFAGLPPSMPFAPNAAYEIEHRFPHSKQNVTNAQNRHKHHDRHK